MSAVGDKAMSASDNDEFKKEFLRQLGELSKNIAELQKDVAQLKQLPKEIAKLQELPDKSNDIKKQFLSIQGTQLNIKDKINDITFKRRFHQTHSSPQVAIEKRRIKEMFNTPGPATLSDQPRDLMDLWKEYKFGNNGSKPAEQFTSTERNQTKHYLKKKYYDRKVVWDCLAGLIRAGNTAEGACHMIRSHYGYGKSLNQIINLIKKDRHNNSFPKQLSGVNEPNLPWLDQEEKEIEHNEEKPAAAQVVIAPNIIPAPVNIEEGDVPGCATLVERPKALIELWNEYKFGIDGRKPAKQFTTAERNIIKGGMKQKYYRRKIIWDCIEKLIEKAGHTPEDACNIIQTHYGTTRITKITKRMIKDRANNSLPKFLR